MLRQVELPSSVRGLGGIFNIDAGQAAGKLIAVAIIWLLAWGAIRLLDAAANRLVRRVDDGDDGVMTPSEKRGHTVAQLLRSVGRVVVFALAALITLNQFINIGPLLAGAGILGLAVSFGAQSLVKDVITGFFLLAENSIAVGDVVEIAGKSGTVEKVTLRVVQLRDLKGALHIVPNGQITVVSNLTRGWSRAVVDVGVAYGTDLAHAIEVFRDEANSMATVPAWQLMLDGPPEVLGVQQLGDSGVTIRVLLRTQPGKQWGVAREFRRRIKERLEREQIEIPFPQQMIHVRASGPVPDASAAETPSTPSTPSTPFPAGS